LLLRTQSRTESTLTVSCVVVLLEQCTTRPAVPRSAAGSFMSLLSPHKQVSFHGTQVVIYRRAANIKQFASMSSILRRKVSGGSHRHRNREKTAPAMTSSNQTTKRNSDIIRASIDRATSLLPAENRRGRVIFVNPIRNTPPKVPLIRMRANAATHHVF